MSHSSANMAATEPVIHEAKEVVLMAATAQNLRELAKLVPLPTYESDRNNSGQMPDADLIVAQKRPRDASTQISNLTKSLPHFVVGSHPHQNG